MKYIVNFTLPMSCSCIVEAENAIEAGKMIDRKRYGEIKHLEFSVDDAADATYPAYIANAAANGDVDFSVNYAAYVFAGNKREKAYITQSEKLLELLTECKG